MAGISSAGDAVARLKLRKDSPECIRVRCQDGSQKDVAIPPKNRRRRWEQVTAAVEALSWARMEVLDSKGRVLAIMDNDELGSEEMEDLTPAMSTRGSEVASMVSLMIKAQSVALKHQQDGLRTVLTAQTDMLKMLTSRLMEAEEARREDMSAITDLMEELGEVRGALAGAKAKGPDDEGGSELMQLIKGGIEVAKMPDS